MELDKWITTNKLVVSNPNQSLYVIEDFGSFLFLEPKEEKIIDKDFGFVLDDVDVHRIEKYKPKYFLFEFGERYYYSPIETYKNSKGQQLFKVYFNNFQNISSCSEECFFEDFCHLGIHSEYELLNGSGSVDDWVKKAKFYNIKSIGICDKNTLASSLGFQLACQKKGIKSILGETVTVAYDYKYEQFLKHDVKLFVKNKQGLS